MTNGIMIRIYASLVRKNEKSLSEVPENLREAVYQLLTKGDESDGAVNSGQSNDN